MDVTTDDGPAVRRSPRRRGVKARARSWSASAYRLAGRVGVRLLGPDPRGPDPETPPWLPLPEGAGVLCNICRWQGQSFDDAGHVELTLCPRCGSIARDRFVHWCLAQRVELHNALRVIECSPRLGKAYRTAMSTWFFYRTSDYELRAHVGNLRLDLQNMDLPDDSVDVIVCAHVLEHVPDTDKALAELRRVVAPGGHLLLQVPVLQPRTAQPPEPEYHDNDTRVFWRFGVDLTARVRNAGFDTALLCTAEMAAAVASGGNPWAEWSEEFDVPGLLASARADVRADDLVVVADRRVSARIGFEPGYQFLTWDCRVPD